MVYKARSNKNMINCIRLFEATYINDFIVFDVETTGKSPDKDYIVQFSAIKYGFDGKKLVGADKMDIYIKPPVIMDQKVIDIHGITNEFLEDKPCEKEVFERISSFMGNSPIVVGYNVFFDINMLSALYGRNDSQFKYTVALDVIEMARDIITRDDTEDYKLSSIASLYGIDNNISFHNSLDDVKATTRLLVLFYKEYKEKLKHMDYSGKECLYVNYLYYWKGYNKVQTGIYVNTNLGKIWISTYNKCWMSSQINLDDVNIDHLERTVIDRTGLSFTELSKMTERKFELLKQSKGGYI